MTVFYSAAINKVCVNITKSVYIYLVPPRLDQLVNRTMIEGGNGYLLCSVIAKPAAVMRFQKLGGPYMPPLPYIPPNPFDYELGENVRSLILFSLTEHDYCLCLYIF